MIAELTIYHIVKRLLECNHHTETIESNHHLKTVTFVPESGVHCYECGTTGHVEYDCPRLRAPVIAINYCEVCHSGMHSSIESPKELRKEIKEQRNKIDELTYLMRKVAANKGNAH